MSPRAIAPVSFLWLLLVPSLAFAADGNVTDQNIWVLWGTAFTAGLGASLTPCVYPMIPIVLGIFGARGRDVTRGRSLWLATLYVLGMGTTYATLGTIFALLGKQFGTVLSEPAVVIPLVLLYIALAVSMFGAFELNLPSSLQNRLASVGGKGSAGAYAMGLVGGLTAAPCTGPFVAGLLTAVAKTGNVGIGASTLFIHALGIGVLYWVLAVFAGSMPKSGRWMEWVKSIGGIGLLVASLYFLRPIVPALRTYLPHWGWAVGAGGLVVLGLVLGAVHLSFHERRQVVRKAVGVALVTVGAFAIIMWLLSPKRVLPWRYDEAAAFAEARADGKGVMVDFSATWCTPCAELELTFGADQVYPRLIDGFVPLKFDVTEDTALNKERQARYGAHNLPAVLFLDPDGNLLARVDSALGPAEFAKQLPARPAPAVRP